MIQFHNGKFINNDGWTHYCWLQTVQSGPNTNASLYCIGALSRALKAVIFSVAYMKNTDNYQNANSFHILIAFNGKLNIYGNEPLSELRISPPTLQIAFGQVWCHRARPRPGVGDMKYLVLSNPRFLLSI